MTSDYLVPIVIVVVALLVILVIARSVRVIQQGNVGVVQRLGQFRLLHDPGVAFIVPFIDTLTRVDIRETPRTGDRQEVITRDNVSLTVNATIFSQVIDAKLALFGVSNYFIAVDQLARTTLRSVIGGLTLDDALSQRERINAELQQKMEFETDKWGVRINRVEIVDITPPAQILQALSLQKTADQEKRARILQSEGQQQSQVNIADGQRQSAIKTAEGQKQAAILAAEGERQAQVLLAEGQKQAAILEAEGRAKAIAAVYGAIKAEAPDPALVAILQLDTLAKFADSENAKLVVPVETAGILGAAQALRSVIDGMASNATGSEPAPLVSTPAPQDGGAGLRG